MKWPDRLKRRDKRISRVDVAMVVLVMVIGLMHYVSLPGYVGFPILLATLTFALAMTRQTTDELASLETRAHQRRVEARLAQMDERLERIATALERQVDTSERAPVALSESPAEESAAA